MTILGNDRLREIAARVVLGSGLVDDYDASGLQYDAGRDWFRPGSFEDNRRRHMAENQIQQAGRQATRAQLNLARAAQIDPTLAAASLAAGNLPAGAEMDRPGMRPVNGVPDDFCDPTTLVIIPDQTVATTASVSVTTPPPSTFFAAYLMISVSASANALVSISAITIGGVPVLQGAGALAADGYAPSSQNLPPIRRIVPTSQPITISLTNNDTATRRASAYFIGYLMRSTASNY